MRRFNTMVAICLIVSMIFCFSIVKTNTVHADNTADSIVDIARGELGSTNYSKYYGGNKGAWCADFVTWCAQTAGVTSIASSSSCYYMYQGMIKNGCKEVTTPQKGDIVFFYCTNCSSTSGRWCHVGIMENSVYSIEGNRWSNGVSKVERGNSYSHNGDLGYRHSNGIKRIYVRPNYNGTSTTPTLAQGTLVNLGNSFSARIKNCTSGKLLTGTAGNVMLDSHGNEKIATQIWKFNRNGDGSYKIISSVTNEAIDLDRAADEDGSNIKILGSYDTTAQNWFIYQRSDGTYYIRSACSSTRVMDIKAGNTSDGSNIQLYTRNDSEAQKFYIDKCGEILNHGDDFWALILSSDCGKPILQEDSGNVVLGTERKDNYNRTLWHFLRNSNTGYYTVYSKLNGKPLDVDMAEDKDGANVKCYDYNSSMAQKWYILKREDGSSYMKSACSSRNMDLLYNSYKDGTNIQMWSNNSSGAQNFTIYKINGQRDKISYNLMSDSANINLGETTSISINNAQYAIDYKLYVVSPDGETETVELGQNNTYQFTGQKKGIYKIYAGVKSPVSDYTGSETDRCISIAVGYDYNKFEKSNCVYNGHLYQLIEKQNVDWVQAKNYCENEQGSYLATITSAGENSAVAKLMNEYKGYAFLGGLRKSSTEFRWMQSSEDDFTYSNWSQGEPDYSNHIICQIKDSYGTYAKDNYIAMMPSGQWCDVPVFDEKVNAFVMESNVQSIELKNISKKVYKEGDLFDKNSIQIEASFADGTKKEVTDYTVSGFDTDKSGEQKVTISYYGVAISFYINVEHNYSSQITKYPSCDDTGVKTYTCKCGESYTEIIAASGHKFEEKTVEPTEEEDGYTLHKCTVCEYSYKDNYTGSKGHNYVLTETKEAGCTVDGYKKYKCSDCDREYTEALLATGHKYTDTVVKPTCTENGYTLHRCEHCGDTYKDAYVSAKGHEYTSTITTEATCTVDGLMTYTCRNCNEKKTSIILASGHNYISSIVEPTCEKHGYTLHKCTKCGVSYKDNYTENTAHDYVCNIIKQATCQATGTKEYVCKKCDDSYTETISRTEHNYSKNIKKYSTCSYEGLAEYVCGICGDSYTETIKKTDHKYSQRVVLPTLTNEGYTLNVCTVCGHEIKTNIVPKLKENKISKNDKVPKVTKLKLKAGKKRILLSWKKVSKVDGYEIQYSQNSKMKKNKKFVIKGNKAKKVIKKLKSKKKYYVRIRAYKKNGKKVVYGKYTNVVGVKAK